MTNSAMTFRTTGYGSRRDFLSRAGAGCGTLALASLLAGEATAAPDPRAPLAAQLGHHVPSAKSVIWLFMHGAPSQVDTWDYKPALARRHGQTVPVVRSCGHRSRFGSTVTRGPGVRNSSHGPHNTAMTWRSFIRVLPTKTTIRQPSSR